MEEILHRLAEAIALGVEMVAIILCGIGASSTVIGLVKIQWQRPGVHGARKEVWRNFGMWLLFGLEFELAADILRTVIAPTWEDIGALGAIAVIRTFLNHFLEKDLERATEPASP
jgi:uncharacterized membrane protein